jgi:hypothetical protein
MFLKNIQHSIKVFITPWVRQYRLWNRDVDERELLADP